MGVGDWARKPGQRYGAIRVDLEQRRVVDPPPDRTAASFATWLRAHARVAVIARDGASASANEARQGASTALQVADRFRMLANVGETLERVLARTHALLRETTLALTRARATTAEPAQDPLVVEPVEPNTAPRPPARCDHETAAHRSARLDRSGAVIDLDRQGISQVPISAQVGTGRKSVRRCLRAGTFPKRAPRAAAAE